MKLREILEALQKELDAQNRLVCCDVRLVEALGNAVLAVGKLEAVALREPCGLAVLQVPVCQECFRGLWPNDIHVCA